jgi:hypothetical protein
MNPEFTREIPIARRRKLRTGDMKSRRRITCVMRTTHPRKPSSTKPDGTRVTAAYRTPLMVLITKVKMVTSRARTARGSPPLPDGLARATCRQCQDQGLRTSVGRNNVNDEATPLPASPRAVAIVPTRCVRITSAVPVAHRHNPKEVGFASFTR